MNKAIIHPILFSIFPIMSFYCSNKQNYPINVIIFPITASVLFALISCLFLYAILKNESKAALLVSLFLLLFYSYGHFEALVNDKIKEIAIYVSVNGSITSEKIIFVLWAIIFLLGSYFCLIKIHNISKNFTKFLNITAAFLVFVPVIVIAAYEVGAIDSQYGPGKDTISKTISAGSGKTTTTPDIYYIILDGYGRADILDEVYNYKNDEFLTYLNEKGFYIADKSRANYCQTALSLASSLNMQYLDDVTPQAGTDSGDRRVLIESLTDNRVVRFLKQRGYRFIALSSGYFATEIREADVYLGNFWSLNEFHRGLIESTVLTPILRPFQSYRRNILNTFQTLEKLPEYKSPFFAFVHITTPHPPFVFNPNGGKSQYQARLPSDTGIDASGLIKNRSDRAAYLRGYRDQLIYVNKMVMKSIDSILRKSERPPVIILQSDHGPGAYFDLEDVGNSYIKERLSILNSYYIPNGGSRHLYKGITPVNSFRIVFNHYFGTNYVKLEDKSYYSTWSHPFHFFDVTETIGITDLASFIDSGRLNLRFDSGEYSR